MLIRRDSSGRGIAATLVSSPTCLPSASSSVARRRQVSFEAEAAEGAMHVAARADALDDLLTEVAAFVEVQGAGLSGLLREFAVADVDSVEWRAFEDSQPSRLCASQ